MEAKVQGVLKICQLVNGGQVTGCLKICQLVNGGQATIW